jgi:aldose 1-epimerase
MTLGPVLNLQAELSAAVWGRISDGSVVEIFTLRSTRMEVRVTSYGARLVSIRTPDRKGHMGDVILGYDSLQNYVDDGKTHFGTVVGRFGNRIAGGTFTIDGKRYQIPINNGRNALHGGTVGFDKHVWKGNIVAGGVEFVLVSPDGDMGFPGTLTAKVRYSLNDDVLRIEYSAMTDKPTVVNLTNHAYFNLSGDDSKDILADQLLLNADLYTPVDAEMIPTGERASVAGTPMDFRRTRGIGSRIQQTDQQLLLAGGYDHNFILNGKLNEMKLAAILHDPESGRTLTIMTTEPGIQFYSGNKLDGTFIGRYGRTYKKYAGLCLETQHFPDSPNEPSFPSTLLTPSTQYHSTTILKFTVQ